MDDNADHVEANDPEAVHHNAKPLPIWVYALPVVIAMVAGYLLQEDKSLGKLIPFAIFVAALSYAFYIAMNQRTK